MNNNIQNEAKKIAKELRDECDCSYVVSERKNNININGVDLELKVCAWWEKEFYFEYSATSNGIKIGSGRSFVY
jgi:translation initiation factor 1 (eIF-1/SUI1)